MESGYQKIASISPKGTHTHTPLAIVCPPFSPLSFRTSRYDGWPKFYFYFPSLNNCCVPVSLLCSLVLLLSLFCTLYLGHVMSSPRQSLTALFPSLLSLFFSIGVPNSAISHDTNSPSYAISYQQIQHQERYSHTGTSQTSS